MVCKKESSNSKGTTICLSVAVFITVFIAPYFIDRERYELVFSSDEHVEGKCNVVDRKLGEKLPCKDFSDEDRTAMPKDYMSTAMLEKYLQHLKGEE